jgi:hypothetical protein
MVSPLGGMTLGPLGMRKFRIGLPFGKERLTFGDVVLKFRIRKDSPLGDVVLKSRVRKDSPLGIRHVVLKIPYRSPPCGNKDSPLEMWFLNSVLGKTPPWGWGS